MKILIIIFAFASFNILAKEEYITSAEAKKIREDYIEALKRKQILDELESKNQIIEETRNRVQALKNQIAETEKQKQEAIESYNTQNNLLTESYNQKLKERIERIVTLKKQESVDEKNCSDQQCKNEVIKNYNTSVLTEDENLKQIKNEYKTDKTEIDKDFSTKTKTLEIQIQKDSSYYTGGIK